MPRRAIREIGALRCGDEKSGQKPLDVGTTSSPLFTTEGIYVVHKISGPEDRQLTDVMRASVNRRLLEDWEQERLRVGAKEGWVKMNFNSDLYKWVADQVALTAPRNQSGVFGNQPALR